MCMPGTMRFRQFTYFSQSSVQARANSKAFFSIANGRGKSLCQSQTPKTAGRLAPTIGTTRHIHSMNAPNWHRCVPQFMVALYSRGPGRAPATVEPIQFSTFSLIDKHKYIAAQTTDKWIHNLQHGTGCDSGVN